MNNQPPIVIRCLIGGIILDVCHGEIPDIFCTSKFGELIELELPDAKGTNKEFQNWLISYRQANPSFEKQLLKVAKCN